MASRGITSVLLLCGLAAGHVWAADVQPDLPTLAERCDPGYRGPHATRGFEELLALRKRPDAKAVPVLEQILVAHANSSRIHGFAAAQALFCIGTPEAHEVLKKRLLRAEYDTKQSTMYAFHWDMEPAKRNGFIEQYLLQNLATDLSVSLSVKDPDAQPLVFVVTVRNTSKEDFAVLENPVFRGFMLFFKDAAGTFCQRVETVAYVPPSYQWKELMPGESLEYEVELRAESASRLDPRQAPPKDVKMVLMSHDTRVEIRTPGRLTVTAMYASPPPSAAAAADRNAKKRWHGRAVSEPLGITVLEP